MKKKRITTTQIKKWQAMLTTQRFLSIALFFGLYDYAMLFQRFEAFEKTRALTLSERDERSRLMEGMLQRILQGYGVSVQKTIYHVAFI